MFVKSVEGKGILTVQSNVLLYVSVIKVKVDLLILLTNYEGNLYKSVFMQMLCIYKLFNY